MKRKEITFLSYFLPDQEKFEVNSERAQEGKEKIPGVSKTLISTRNAFFLSKFMSLNIKIKLFRCGSQNFRFIPIQHYHMKNYSKLHIFAE